MSNRRSNACPVPGLVPGLWVLALAALLPGCSTTDIDRIPQEIGGLPAGAPARPAESPAFPAVHDMPPPRAASLLDAEQQKKLEADLIAIRNRQPNQQKNIARAKAKAEKEAKAKAAKAAKRKPKGGTSGPLPGPTVAGPAAAGTQAGPPWPLPPQNTGGKPRP